MAWGVRKGMHIIPFLQTPVLIIHGTFIEVLSLNLSIKTMESNTLRTHSVFPVDPHWLMNRVVITR